MRSAPHTEREAKRDEVDTSECVLLVKRDPPLSSLGIFEEKLKGEDQASPGTTGEERVVGRRRGITRRCLRFLRRRKKEGDGGDGDEEDAELVSDHTQGCVAVDGDGRPIPSALFVLYEQMMVLSEFLATASPRRRLFLGNGVGTLQSFLSYSHSPTVCPKRSDSDKVSKAFCFHGVERDGEVIALAEKYFLQPLAHSVESPLLTFHCDAETFIERAGAEGLDAYDVVFVDLCDEGKDSEVLEETETFGLFAPPVSFLSEQNLRKVSGIMSGGGIMVANVLPIVSRERTQKREGEAGEEEAGGGLSSSVGASNGRTTEEEEREKVRKRVDSLLKRVFTQVVWICTELRGCENMVVVALKDKDPLAQSDRSAPPQTQSRGPPAAEGPGIPSAPGTQNQSSDTGRKRRREVDVQKARISDAKTARSGGALRDEDGAEGEQKEKEKEKESECLPLKLKRRFDVWLQLQPECVRTLSVARSLKLQVY